MVLLGLAAVIVIVILIIQQPRGSAPTGSTTPPSPSGSPSSSATSNNPADAIACDLSKVTLEASTDAVGYDPGVEPVLSFVLTSRETSPCTVPGGSDIQEFRITSGEELIWSSKDCQVDPVEGTALLQPGVPFAGPTLTWDRTRSSTDTCNTERPEVIANGASYHLEVIVGELKSESTRQFLLY
jgi:hypothetical protein